MILVADENLNRSVIERLESDGHGVARIADLAPTVSDATVLEIAVRSEALLITSDTDFGELIYVLGARHAGVLLVRLGDMPYDQQADLVSRTLRAHGESLRRAFSVLTETRLRTRS